MSNHAAKIKSLNERLKSVHVTCVRIPDSGEIVRVGQLWTIPGLRSDDPGWLFLVLKETGAGMFNAVPCFRWSEWAGPSDLFVPHELAGATLIVSFESETTLSREMLGGCCERLPQQAIDYILRARAAMDDPVERQAFSWGLGYFGRHCVRLARHKAIKTHIETLQAPALKQIPSHEAKPEKTRRLIWKWSSFMKPIPARIVAIAASLCLLLGIGYLGMRHTMVPMAPDIIPVAVQDEPDILPSIQVAACYGKGIFPTDQEVRFRSPDSRSLPPVAYLFDATGGIAVTRSVSIQAGHSCLILQANDKITVNPDSSATVILADAVYFLSNAASYQITGENILVEGRDELPISATLAAGALLPPTDLLDTVRVEADSEMQTKAPAAVLSPHGATYSQTPRIVWRGSDSNTYEVAIKSLTDNDDSVRELLFAPQMVHGAVLHWADTGWPPLPRSSSWRIIIRHAGSNVSDTAHSFTVLSTDAANKISRQLAATERALPPGHARAFIQANLLLRADPSCAAEARLLAIELNQKAPNNIAYMKLIQHGYASMGFQLAVDQVEKRILNILNDQK